VFLNHAGVSPLNTRAVEAMNALNQHVLQLPFTECLPFVGEIVTDFKRRVATLINARSTDEVVMMPNTASGINTAAVSLPFRTGDNVLVIDGDYPANIYPWMNQAYRGVLTKMVPSHNGGVNLDLLAARIDHRTRAIAISSVQFATGFRNDIVAVGKLCRERGLYFVVDGIQSIGALPMDVQAANIDILCCGSQKWLLGPMGAGFLYIRKELLDKLQPGAYVGAASVVDWMNFLDYNLTPLPTADRFMLGSPNFLGTAGLLASIALIQEVGIEHVAQRIIALTDVVIGDLQERGYRFSAGTTPEHRSGIVIVEVDQPEAVSKRLAQAGIVAVPRGKGIRIAPHFYNTEEDVLQVGEALSRMV
jgi:selenocysteine lyase/cysteine desulfurase